MATALYSVQDDNGREVVAWEGEIEKVSEIEASVSWIDGRPVGVITRGGTVLATSDAYGIASDASFTLHRWDDPEDKTSDPVSHPVKNVTL